MVRKGEIDAQLTDDCIQAYFDMRAEDAFRTFPWPCDVAEFQVKHANIINGHISALRHSAVCLRASFSRYQLFDIDSFSFAEP